MNAEIHERFAHINNTDDGRQACAEYVAAILAGRDHYQAEIAASNVLQRAGYKVNSSGGASFRLASIKHNEFDGERVSLTVDYDDAGHYVAGNCDDTGPRFDTPSEAYASIATRWSADVWGLVLAPELHRAEVTPPPCITQDQE